MEFDLSLAVREDSENPVYYVQYAYARICTLLKNLAGGGLPVPMCRGGRSVHADRRGGEGPDQAAGQYPAVVMLAARDYDPSFINRYLSDLAAAFHKFYNACRIKGEAENVLLARLKLADTARAAEKRHDAHRLLRAGEDGNESALPIREGALRHLTKRRR